MQRTSYWFFRFIMITSLLLASSLAACTPVAPTAATGEDTTASEAAGEATELQFWSRLPENEQIDALVQEWNETHPDIQVVHQGIPGADYRTKLLASIAGGNAPDVVSLDVAIMPQYIEQDNLLHLD